MAHINFDGWKPVELAISRINGAQPKHDALDQKLKAGDDLANDSRRLHQEYQDKGVNMKPMEFYEAGEIAGVFKGEAHIIRQEMPGRPTTCLGKWQYPQGKADSWGHEIDAVVERMSQHDRHEQKLREVQRDYGQAQPEMPRAYNNNSREMGGYYGYQQAQPEMPRAYDNNSCEMGGYYGYQQSPPPPPYPHGGYSTQGGYCPNPYERRGHYY